MIFPASSETAENKRTKHIKGAVKGSFLLTFTIISLFINLNRLVYGGA